MTNEKKNIKELVTADDDPTAELEIPVLMPEPADDESEASATTTGYSKDVRSSRSADEAYADDKSLGKSQESEHARTVDRLKFDLEVLRAKWQGLSTEIEAREEQADDLNKKLNSAKLDLQRSESLVAERDHRIQTLESGLKNRDDAYLSLADELEKLHQEIANGGPDDELERDQVLALQAGQLASGGLENRELRARLVRIESYSDQLRYQLRLQVTATADLSNQIEGLEHDLAGANQQITGLQIELEEARSENAELESSIDNLHSAHAEEIRTIRFELGDAQETLTQHELVSEQLAADLMTTRSQREELENDLAKSEENSQTKIGELERINRRLRNDVESLHDKLQSKNEAINSLLTELAESPKRQNTVADIEGTIQEIDERMSEHIDEPGNLERDRVTRLLIGHIDGQKLQFPLFKDRLTIGRTSKNDIQLKSKHVSRRHAVVVIEGDVTRVIDWGSKNGVYVNSRQIKEHFLKNGDVVGVGTAEFRFEERPKRDN